MENTPEARENNHEISQNESGELCKTCNAKLHGRFCYFCGQRTLAGRFTLKSSMSSFFSVIANVDKGLWHTIIWMFTKPQVLLRDCLNGATVKYFHPFRYLFLLLTIQVFIMVSVIDMESITLGLLESSIDANQMEMQKKWMHFVYSYNHLIIASSIPFLALAYWIVFGVKKYNYGEQLIVTAYSYGQIVVIGIFLSFFYLLEGNVFAIGAGSIFLTVTYLFYVNLKFFQGKWWSVFLKTVLAFLIYIILFLIVGLVLGLTYMLYKATTDPEFVNQFKQASSTT